MIKKTSLDFLSKLKKNNSKDWFEQNRDCYDHYKTDILELTENLLTGLLALALMKTLSTACRLPRTIPLETHILKTSLNKFKNTSSPYKPRVRLMVLCQGSCSCTS